MEQSGNGPAAAGRPANGRASTEGKEKNTVPVLNGTIALLERMAATGRGMSIAELVEATSISRSTVYRILKTLEHHRWVHRREHDQTYLIGAGLAQLAVQAVPVPEFANLPAIARPIMEQTAIDCGESVKLSVRHGSKVMVIAVAQGQRENALRSVVGSESPGSVGASAKILLADLPPESIKATMDHERLGQEACTRLLGQIEQVRANGWAHDRGEYDAVTHAFAAPIRDHDGRTIAALSILFIGTKTEQMGESFRLSCMHAAERISTLLAKG